jgi:hypothetical protein
MIRKSPSFPPVKILSSVLLPWWEEEVEEGELFPLTSILSHGGERKIKVWSFPGGICA